MKVYCVGGALRDELLGLAVQDRDWVVVGASPSDLLAQGYTPVGKDFPVFLHPKTHEEYALARTERKSGPGYRGFEVLFDPSVTLEDDLLRRDLTINAMARAEGGALIDPFHGQRDLEQRIFRHVSPAFSEDPVRVLRVARFAARFIDFNLAPETLALMRSMAGSGEISALVAERVWQELARGLMAQKPSRMFDVLQESHALPVLFAPLAVAWCETDLHRLIDQCAAANLSLEQRFAVLCHRLGENVLALSKAWRVPSDCQAMALLVQRGRDALLQAGTLSAEALVALLESMDAKRKPERFERVLQACQVISPFDEKRLRSAQLILSRLDEAAVAKAQIDPSKIKDTMHKARVAALREQLTAI